MKALRWYARRDIRYEEAPEPVPGPGQVKVKVSLAGICGTDLKEYVSGPIMIPREKVPITLGHEFSGKVAALGPGVKDFASGERVTGVGYWYCGECYCCRQGRYNICINQGFAGLSTDGCFADYFIAPAYALYLLPASVPDEAGALVEPLAVGLHAVRQGRVQLGDTVAIVGDGTIGLCCLVAARAAGAGSVYLIAKHRGRGEIARKLGAEVIYLDSDRPAERIRKLTGGPGADVCLECVGSPETPQLAIDLTRRGGSIVLVGVFDRPGTLDFSALTFTERTVVGSSIYIDEGRTAVKLLEQKQINPEPLVTSIVPLQDAARLGFESLIRDKDKNIKVLLRVD